MTAKTVQYIVNGQTITLTYNSATGAYESAPIAPDASSFNLAGGFFPTQLRVESTAGNVTIADTSDSTVGENLKLYVGEQVKPTIEIISPSANAYVINANAPITFKVLDNANGQSTGYSGINKQSLVLRVNGAPIDNSLVSWSDTEGGYIGTYNPVEALPEGSNTVTATISDNDENTSETATVTFIVDTIAPSLDVTSPTEGLLTNNSVLDVSGKTDDATSKPVTVTIELNSVDQGTVTVNADGTFSKRITLKEGVNEIVITATDRAGKSTTITRTVTLDTQAPVVKSVVMTANGKPISADNKALAGKTYSIAVKVG